MASYLQWNDAIAARFFSPEAAGKQIYLQVTDDLISEVGGAFGGGRDDFVAAVLSGPPWVTRTGLCQRGLQAMDAWRDRGRDYPPYIAHLAAFVLAAGLDGDYAPHAYYPRLHDLLGLQSEHMPASFERMYELWEDLETWAIHDRAGELGIFTARSVGGFIHVGYPLAQAILTENERAALPRVFADAGFDPSWPPSRGEVARLVRAKGRHVLRARTLDSLGGSAGEARDVVVDAILEELEGWDGRQATEATGGAEALSSVVGLMRLCLQLDPIARAARARVRCRIPEVFPEDLTVLRSSGLPDLHCAGDIAGWSTTLRVLEDDQEFDASLLDWVRGARLSAEHHGRTEFRLPGATVRLFVDGTPEGLPGLIEVPGLPDRGQVVMIATEAAWASLSSWASTARSFKELGKLHGLPPDLVGASIVDPRPPPDGLLAAFPFLDRSRPIRLRYRGGLRTGVGNTFFAFAPPTVTAEPLLEEDVVECSGLALDVSNPSAMELPPGLALETQHWVEVIRGGQAISRQSLFLASEFGWRSGIAANAEFLEPSDVPESEVRGPDEESTGAFAGFRLWPTSTPGFYTAARYQLVGRRPGEVCAWPGEGLPADWTPVWAVPHKKRQRVIYCGTDVASEAPESKGASGVTRREVDGWREVLWSDRKRVIPPSTPVLADLWRSYGEAARRARSR